MVLGEGVAAHVASGMILAQGHTSVVETYQGSKNLGCPRMRYRPGVYCYREGLGQGAGVVWAWGLCHVVWSGVVVLSSMQSCLTQPHSETVCRHLPLQHCSVQVSRGSD